MMRQGYSCHSIPFEIQIWFSFGNLKLKFAVHLSIQKYDNCVRHNNEMSLHTFVTQHPYFKFDVQVRQYVSIYNL